MVASNDVLRNIFVFFKQYHCREHFIFISFKVDFRMVMMKEQVLSLGFDYYSIPIETMAM